MCFGVSRFLSVVVSFLGNPVKHELVENTGPI